MVSTIWEIIMERWTVSFRRDGNYIDAQKFELCLTKDLMNNDLIRLLGYIQ